MKKMKKACAVVTRSVGPFPPCLPQRSQASTTNTRFENVTPVALRRPVDLDVGDLQMVAEFEQQVVGVAVVGVGGEWFVSFPRNGIDTVKNSVEEVIGKQGGRLPERGDQYLEHRRALDAFSFRAERVRGFQRHAVGAGRGQPRLVHARSSPAGQTRGHRPDDQRGQADHRVPGQSDPRRAHPSTTCALTWRAARRALRTYRIPQRRRASGIIVVDLSTGNAVVRRLANDPTVLPRPGFPRDRGGQAVCHPGDGRRRAFTGIGRGRRPSRVSADGKAGVLLPDCQPELVFRGCRRAPARFHPIRRRRGRDDRELGRQGRSGWLGSGRAGARLSDERGVQRHTAVRSVAGNGGHFQPDV